MRIDVVIPVYPVVEYLSQALGSLEQQELAVHAVVVDDGNDPAVDGESLPQWASLIRNPSPSGISRARNSALPHCTGEALLFLDADDELQPGALPQLMEALQQGADVAYGFVEEFGAAIPAERSERASRDPVALPGSTLLRRECVESIGAFDPTLPTGEFMDLMARGQRAGWRIEAVRRPVLRRRIHGRNASTSSIADPENFLRVVRRHLAESPREATDH